MDNQLKRLGYLPNYLESLTVSLVMLYAYGYNYNNDQLLHKEFSFYSYKFYQLNISSYSQYTS